MTATAIKQSAKPIHQGWFWQSAKSATAGVCCGLDEIVSGCRANKIFITHAIIEGGVGQKVERFPSKFMRLACVHLLGKKNLFLIRYLS